MNWRHWAAGAGLLAVVLGTGAAVTSGADVPGSPPAASAAERAPEPTTITVPRIGVSADLIGLGLDPDGAPTVPDAKTQADQPSWFAPGTRPGEVGPALILGHVDGGGKRGVFWDLGRLRPGDEVLIGRADGSTVRYVIDRLQTVPKEPFPVDLAYGPTERAEIRLITCTGKFDRTTHQYDSNLIAFGHLEQ